MQRNHSWPINSLGRPPSKMEHQLDRYYQLVLFLLSLSYFVLLLLWLLRLLLQLILLSLILFIRGPPFFLFFFNLTYFPFSLRRKYESRSFHWVVRSKQSRCLPSFNFASLFCFSPLGRFHSAGDRSLCLRWAVKKGCWLHTLLAVCRWMQVKRSCVLNDQRKLDAAEKN